MKKILIFAIGLFCTTVVTFGQAQYTTTGAGNAYILSYPSNITTLTSGLRFTFKANHSNTGSATLNINSLGATTIKTAVTSNLVANDIKVDQEVTVVFDGTNFQMMTPSGNAGGGSAGWNLTGNTGTISTDYVGTTDKKNLNFATDGITQMQIDTFGNIGIGSLSLANYKMYILHTQPRTLNLNNNYAGLGTKYGIFNWVSTDGGGAKYGVFNYVWHNAGVTNDAFGTQNNIDHSGTGESNGVKNSITSNGSGFQYGSYNLMGNTGTGERFGVYNSLNQTNAGSTNPLTGVFNEINTQGNGTSYGVRNIFYSSGSGTQIGTQNNINNSGTGDKYGVGTNILESNAAASNDLYGASNAIENAGTGLTYGTKNSITSGGTGAQYGIHLRMVNEGSGERFGIYNEMTQPLAGSSNDMTGTRNWVETAGSGLSYGTINTITSSGSGDQYAVFNSIENAGTGNKAGTYNSITQNAAATASDLWGTLNEISSASTVAQNLYGTRSLIANNSNSGASYGLYIVNGGTSTGDKYGIYSDGEDYNYFYGNVGIGNATPNEEFVIGTNFNTGWGIPAATIGDATAGGAIEVGSYNGTVASTHTLAMESGATFGRAKITATNGTGLGLGDIEFVVNRIGIGTNPGVKLDVVGIIRAKNPGSSMSGSEIALSSPNANIGITISSGDGSGGVNRRWDIEVEAVNTFFKISDKTAGATRLTIDNTGNVGIGTTTPSEKLEVNGNIQQSSDANKFIRQPLHNGTNDMVAFCYGNVGGGGGALAGAGTTTNFEAIRNSQGYYTIEYGAIYGHTGDRTWSGTEVMIQVSVDYSTSSPLLINYHNTGNAQSFDVYINDINAQLQDENFSFIIFGGQ